MTNLESAGIGTPRAFVFDVNDRDLTVLEKVMAGVFYAHHYEEPVGYLREDRAAARITTRTTPAACR